MKQRFSEEQIIAILQEAESAPSKAEVCRKHGISEWTFCRWREKYQGLTVSQLRKLKQLEQENERLKRRVAEQALAQEALKDVLAKKTCYALSRVDPPVSLGVASTDRITKGRCSFKTT